MSSPWQLRVTSASSLLLRSSAIWAMNWVLSKLMLQVSQSSEMLGMYQLELEHQPQCCQELSMNFIAGFKERKKTVKESQ